MNIHCTSTPPKCDYSIIYSHIKSKRGLKLLQFYTKDPEALVADTVCVCWGSEISPVKCCSLLPWALPNSCCFYLLVVKRKGRQKTRPCGA